MFLCSDVDVRVAQGVVAPFGWLEGENLSHVFSRLEYLGVSISSSDGDYKKREQKVILEVSRESDSDLECLKNTQTTDMYY